jgi:hypothetical protein
MKFTVKKAIALSYTFYKAAQNRLPQNREGMVRELLYSDVRGGENPSSPDPTSYGNHLLNQLRKVSRGEKLLQEINEEEMKSLKKFPRNLIVDTFTKEGVKFYIFYPRGNERYVEFLKWADTQSGIIRNILLGLVYGYQPSSFYPFVSKLAGIDRETYEMMIKEYFGHDLGEDILEMT